MKTLKIGVVMLALLLAAMVMVPMVSAGEEKNSNSGPVSDSSTINLVPVTEARLYAQEALIEAAALNQFGDSVDWNNAKIDPEPQMIYDLNGDLLFYQFGIEKELKIIGMALASSNKVTGSPIVLFGTANENQLNPNFLKKNAEGTILKNFPGYKIISEKLVCYSYPKIGLFVEISDARIHGSKKIIIDSMNPTEYLIVPESITGLSSESKMWSYYNEIPVKEKEKNLIQWNDAVNRIRKITDSDDYKIIQSDIKVTPQSMTIIKPKIMSTLAGGQLKLINYGYFPTAQQIGTNFCNVATAQIITTFYWMVGQVPSVRSQQDIAIKMNAWPNGGPTWSNEENYYRDTWSSGGLGKDNYRFYFSGPGISTIQEQVNANQPFKIGLGPHARACYGYDTSVSPTRIYFSDPGTGTKYYETLQTYNNHLRMNIPYP